MKKKCKNWFEGFWSIMKWTFLIFGIAAFVSAFIDLGCNEFDILAFGIDINRRILPKCLYELLG